MILIDIKYTKGLEIIDKYRDLHLEYLANFYKQNLILASGPYNNRQGGFIISKMNYKQAKSYIAKDPFSLNNLGDFSIKDFIPTRASGPFKLLIESQQHSNFGKELFEQLHGKHAGEQLIKSLSEIAPDFAKLTFDFAFESIFARSADIPMLTKELITIAICCALGDCQAQIQSHLEAALKLGATKKMIIETLFLVIPFAGFPRVANSLLEINF